MKKYYRLERDNGFYLIEKGNCKISKGVLFKTNGFEEYANEHGIIYRPTYVMWTQFDYSFKVPFKDFFSNNNKIKVNTRIRIIKNDNVSLNFEKDPIFIHLNWRERLCLSYRFGNLLVQKKDFWMWFTNVMVALGATFAGFMVVFC